jgi:hypothetical protein
MNKIIYLLKNDAKEIAMLKESLNLLNINFLPHNNYPIVILCDEIIDQLIIDDIKKYSNTEFKFIFIDFNSHEYSKNIKEDISEYIYVNGVERGFGIGYRNMCRLYSYGMYEIEELKNTNYYLRLDCDSYFVDKIEYDIFKKMEDNNYIYGYNCVTTDNPVVCQNLWELSKEYSHLNIVKKTPIDEITQYNMYYTNFEIAKFDWFENSEYKDYFKFLDNENGIYKWRWGDSIIKYLGVEMFLDDSKKHQFNIPYIHGNIFNI